MTTERSPKKRQFLHRRSLRRRCFNVVGIIICGGGKIVEKIWPDNTTLQQIEGLTYESLEDEHRIRQTLVVESVSYVMDFVTNATMSSVPLEDWGDVLMRIGTKPRSASR